MKNELYNLEGKTDAVSLNELFELRGKFTDFISPCRSSGKKGLSEWLDASILGDGFHIGFEYEEKIYSLRLENLTRPSLLIWKKLISVGVFRQWDIKYG